MELRPEIWTANVVYAGFGTPMLSGGVAVVGGHVAAVGGLDELKRAYPDVAVVAKGKAITPPVVNAHTHLDLSTLPHLTGSYAGFIRHVIQNSNLRNQEAAQAGLSELNAHATGAFGDIVYNAKVMDWLIETVETPATLYWEVVNWQPGQAREIFENTRQKLEAWKARNRKATIGLSPHTAHTVSAPLLKLLVEYAVNEGLPVQIHLAESREEITLFTDGTGPLAELMPSLRSVWTSPKTSPVQYLAGLGVLKPGVALVHVVQVDDNDVKTLAQAGVRVISCPRSNQLLNCGRMPWELFAKHGVEVALGTDSRASSPDLDVKKEVEFLWDKVDPRLLVRAATRGGYRALGLECPRLVRGTPVSQVQFW